MIVYILIMMVGIFAVWTAIYSDYIKKERNKLMNNLKKYEQKKREK